MRPFWSGILSFGLVSIPVDLYPGVRPGGAPFRLLDEDGTALERRYFCPEHDQEVPPEHLVRGYEVEEDRYVVVTDEELAALDPKKSREIDLRLFVPREEIPPLYFERAYFLAPGAESGKAYPLLARVMERTKRAGIATFVMHDQEYLVAIVSEGGLLRAETLRFHDEVRTPPRAGGDANAPAPLVKKFEAAIDSLATDRLPTAELTDDYADRIRELAEKKSKHASAVVHSDTPSPAPGADVIDLMAVLKRSLAESSGKKAAPANRTRAKRHA